MWRSIGSILSGSKNVGVIAETAKIDLDSTEAPVTAKIDSNSESTEAPENFATLVHGVGGHAAAADTYEGVFYAYIHNIRDDNTWRIVIIFQSSDIADQWWRAMSTSTFPFLVNSIRRVTPQFYTHDLNLWNCFTFFTDARITSISGLFRGKMFLALQNDRGGRGINIIPPQVLVSARSGNWFSIRSKINPNQHWYYDEGLGCILVSDTKRTLFRISALDMHDGAIMIGSDDVTLVAQHHGFVVPNESSVARVLGVTGEQSQAFKFKFEDLKEGKFIPGTESVPSPLCYIPQGGAGTGWVLA